MKQNCYVYWIKHKSTGKKYIGSKYAFNADPDTFWLNYFTSSKLVNALIKEYGIDDFVYRILREFGNDEMACLTYEKTLLDLAVERSDYLNLSNSTRMTDSYDNYYVGKEYQRKVASVYGLMSYKNKTGMHQFTAKEKQIICSKGGIAAAKINKQLGCAIFDEEVRKKQHDTLREQQISAFYDPKLRQAISSKGGKNGGFTSAYYARNGKTEQDRLKDQSDRGKIGGPKNKGFKWYNDSKQSYKYTAKMQQEQDFELFLEGNPAFTRGRCARETQLGKMWVNDGIKNMMITPNIFNSDKHTTGRMANGNKN